MTNYKIMWTNENVKWPAYVSTVILEGEQLRKATEILKKALKIIEAHKLPKYNIHHLKSAKRTGLYFYEIIAEFVNPQGEVRECRIMILNEPWMKANSIAAASLECVNDIYNEKLIINRKKGVKYYKGTEAMLYDKKVQKVPLVTDV